MTNAELDTMWFQAQHDAIKAGEDFTRYRFAAIVAAAQREKVAAWMRSMGYATGHGDTVEDLLGELRAQIAEGLEAEVMMEREACAKVCDGWAAYGSPPAASCAKAIRARGNK
jgi:hypothetical protein